MILLGRRELGQDPSHFPVTLKKVKVKTASGLVIKIVDAIVYGWPAAMRDKLELCHQGAAIVKNGGRLAIIRIASFCRRDNDLKFPVRRSAIVENFSGNSRGSCLRGQCVEAEK